MADQKPDAARTAAAKKVAAPAKAAKAAKASKTAAKKATPAPKKTTPSAATAKKVVAKKAVAKETVAKKAAAKKTVAKKAAANKSVAKKSVAKKAASKKAAAARTPAATKAAEVPAPPVRVPGPAPRLAGSTTEAAPSAEPDAPGVSAFERARSSAQFPPPANAVDRPWLLSYPPLVPESYPYPNVPLTRLLDDAAKDFPDSIAVDYLGKTLTYRRVHDQVDRFATALQAMGVTKGDRVGIALPNCPQHLITFFAVLRLGAIVVEIDASADEESLAAVINDAGCKVLVVLDPVYAKVANLKGQLLTVGHVVGTAISDYMTPLAAGVFNFRHRNNRSLIHKIPAAEGVLRFADLVHRHPPTAAQEPLDPSEDVALLVYPPRATPRAIMLTHANLLANIFQVRLWVPDVQAGRETILCAVPFSQPFGIVTGPGLGVLSAATMTLVPSFDRDEILGIIAKREPTLVPSSAGMVDAIAGAPNLRRHDLTSVRVCLCDTATLSADVVTAFEGATGGRLREALSLPEAAGMTHANPVYGKAKAGRIGLPLSDTTCLLLDRDDPTRLAPAGTAGQLAIHGPQVMKGYWEHPEDTQAALRNGWLLTGWIAEIDDEGYYAITGRLP